MNVTVWFSGDEDGYFRAGYDEVSNWFTFNSQAELFKLLAGLAEECVLKVQFVYNT